MRNTPDFVHESVDLLLHVVSWLMRFRMLAVEMMQLWGFFKYSELELGDIKPPRGWLVCPTLGSVDQKLGGHTIRIGSTLKILGSCFWRD